MAKIWSQSRYPLMDEKKKKYAQQSIFSHKAEQDHVICRKMNATGDHCVKSYKPDLWR